MNAAHVLKDITLPEGYEVETILGDRTEWRVRGMVTDIDTGRHGWQAGPWRTVPTLDGPSGLVRAVFTAYLAFIEHEARESFLYRGARVFGPHIDVDALVDVADRLDYR